MTSLRLIDQRSPHHGHFNEEDEFESDLDEQVAFETGEPPRAKADRTTHWRAQGLGRAE